MSQAVLSVATIEASYSSWWEAHALSASLQCSGRSSAVVVGITARWILQGWWPWRCLKRWNGKVLMEPIKKPPKLIVKFLSFSSCMDSFDLTRKRHTTRIRHPTEPPPPHVGDVRSATIFLKPTFLPLLPNRRGGENPDFGPSLGKTRMLCVCACLLACVRACQKCWRQATSIRIPSSSFVRTYLRTYYY